MSLRKNYPSARPSESHYFITIAHGARQRRLAIRPGVLYAIVGVFPLLGALYLAATAYLFFRDDMVANLLARHARQQYAYEDRLAAMRAQLDVVTSRQLLDQDSFEGKMQNLAKRQSLLETHTALVASLSEKINLSANEAVGSILGAARGALTKTAPTATGWRPAGATRAPDPSASFYAPNAGAAPSDKPRPELESHSSLNLLQNFGLRLASTENDEGQASEERKILAASDPEPEISADTKLEQISRSLDLVEQTQTFALNRLRAPTLSAISRLKTALAETGLETRVNARSQANSAVGGPFKPVALGSDATPFERQLQDVRTAYVSLEKIRGVLPYLPLRKPLSGPLELTSGFGYRTDPFLGRAAMHSGADFRADAGTSVLATAGGKVTSAGPSGGYGNMVEIDHGAGVSTRYGHLSSILVAEGEYVTPGAVIGRVGSTGRSTGPHLHYEVRLDDEATDPTRYLKAAKIIAVAE